MVTGERADETILNLKNPTARPGEVELVCGGQVASFGLEQLLAINAAVDAFLDDFPEGLGPEWEVEE